MDKKAIDAILDALRRGHRVELTMGPDGAIKAKTVSRKELKI